MRETYSEMCRRVQCELNEAAGRLAARASNLHGQFLSMLASANEAEDKLRAFERVNQLTPIGVEPR